MSWVYPIPGANTSQAYGVENSSYSAGYHTGMDLSVSVGTKVQSVAKGTVVRSGWGGAYGNYIIIRHPNGYFSLYAHLSNLNVQTGDKVGKGTYIGASGNTGNSSGPHLHFEVRDTMQYGSDVDPLEFFGGKRSDTGGSVGPNSTSGGGGMGQKDKLSPSELAEQYGWAASFLNSEPELKKLFAEAVKKGWSPAEFQAKLRDTKWFQQNSETVRQNSMLKETDPATYKDRYQEIRATIKDLAGTAGAILSDKQLDRVAENALMFGWSDSQIQNTMAQYIERVKGSYVGEAGANEDELMSYARQMGVRMDRGQVRQSVEQMAAGNWDMNRAKDYVNRVAMNQFPNLKDEIKAGLTVYELASPYIQSMSGILELNPNDIDLFDPKIRRALAGKGQDGKPEMKTVWEFEENLRRDPRWLKTNNGRETVAAGYKQVLSDFGLE